MNLINLLNGFNTTIDISGIVTYLLVMIPTKKFKEKIITHNVLIMSNDKKMVTGGDVIEALEASQNLFLSFGGSTIKIITNNEKAKRDHIYLSKNIFVDGLKVLMQVTANHFTKELEIKYENGKIEIFIKQLYKTFIIESLPKETIKKVA